MALERALTVTVHVPEGVDRISRSDLVRLCSERVGKERIKCIQDLGKYFRVTFASLEAKEKFSEEDLVLNGIIIPVQPADNTKLVRVVRLPFEVPDANLLAVLERYGTVVSSTLEFDKTDDLPTGTRLVRMRLTSSIPNRMHCLGYPFGVWYPGQPKQCHHCLSHEHLVANCPNKGLCRICRLPGHMARECPQRENNGSAGFVWGARPGLRDECKEDQNKDDEHENSESDSEQCRLVRQQAAVFTPNVVVLVAVTAVVSVCTGVGHSACALAAARRRPAPIRHLALIT